MPWQSHGQWADEVIARHDAEKPFAPENGEALKFAIGDEVIYTNDGGGEYKRRITGFYKPAHPSSLYASGYRYLIDSDSPWFPAKESSLRKAAK